MSSLLPSIISTVSTGSLLYPLGKFIYGKTIGNNSRKNLTNQDVNPALSQLDIHNLDYASSLSQKNATTKLAAQQSRDANDLSELLQKLNMEYNNSEKQDSFRGNYQ